MVLADDEQSGVQLYIQFKDTAFVRRFFLLAISGRFVQVIAASSGSDHQTNSSSQNLLYHSSPVDSALMSA